MENLISKIKIYANIERRTLYFIFWFFVGFFVAVLCLFIYLQFWYPELFHANPQLDNVVTANKDFEELKEPLQNQEKQRAPENQENQENKEITEDHEKKKYNDNDLRSVSIFAFGAGCLVSAIYVVFLLWFFG